MKNAYSKVWVISVSVSECWPRKTFEIGIGSSLWHKRPNSYSAKVTQHNLSGPPLVRHAIWVGRTPQSCKMILSNEL